MYKQKDRSAVNCDFMTRFLRTRIATLIDILREVEEGSAQKDYSKESLKTVTRDLDWFRKECFKN